MKKKKNIQPISDVAEKPRKKAENKSTAEKFKISIQLGNVILNGEGLTALEALQNIPVPLKITTKGLITISQGKKKKELVYAVPKLRRLFYPNAQPILVKYLVSLLK